MGQYIYFKFSVQKKKKYYVFNCILILKNRQCLIKINLNELHTNTFKFYSQFNYD